MPSCAAIYCNRSQVAFDSLISREEPERSIKEPSARVLLCLISIKYTGRPEFIMDSFRDVFRNGSVQAELLTVSGLERAVVHLVAEPINHPKDTDSMNSLLGAIFEDFMIFLFFHMAILIFPIMVMIAAQRVSNLDWSACCACCRRAPGGVFRDAQSRLRILIIFQLFLNTALAIYFPLQSAVVLFGLGLSYAGVVYPVPIGDWRVVVGYGCVCILGLLSASVSSLFRLHDWISICLAFENFCEPKACLVCYYLKALFVCAIVQGISSLVAVSLVLNFIPRSRAYAISKKIKLPTCQNLFCFLGALVP